MPYDILASADSVDRAIKSLRDRNIEVHRAGDRGQALDKLKELIPAGASLMTGGSTTLEQIGFVDILKSRQHPWKSVKDEIFAEKDPAKQAEIRKRSVLADYFIGSVHAIAETGEVVVASASGSQIPAYAFTSDHVIWIAGTHKIVPTLEDGFRRVREHCLPLEDKRMKSTGAPGSFIGKLLIMEKEMRPGRVSLILVDEVLGF